MGRLVVWLAVMVGAVAQFPVFAQDAALGEKVSGTLTYLMTGATFVKNLLPERSVLCQYWKRHHPAYQDCHPNHQSTHEPTSFKQCPDMLP